MELTKCLGGVLLLSVTACSSGQKSFNNMNEEELFTYNLDKPLMDQVICQERRRSASRIRNSVCMTVREMATEGANGYRKLQLINHRAPVASFNQARR